MSTQETALLQRGIAQLTRHEKSGGYAFDADYDGDRWQSPKAPRCDTCCSEMATYKRLTCVPGLCRWQARIDCAKAVRMQRQQGRAS